MKRGGKAMGMGWDTGRNTSVRTKFLAITITFPSVAVTAAEFKKRSNIARQRVDLSILPR